MTVICQHCQSGNLQKRGLRDDKQRYLCNTCSKWFVVDVKARRLRLFFDIETSPNVGLFWSPGRKISISHDNIIKERAIICIAWKWAKEKQVSTLQWDNKQCDKAMLEKFVKVMSEADEVVGHNGDRFDITWIRTRCIKHGIPMDHTIVSQDTLKLARSKFRFNSNTLDYIADFLGFGKKKHTTYQLWKDILLDNSPKAMKTMIDYCKHDVVLLEKVWDKLMPFAPAKTSIASKISNCPECGSDNTIVNKHRTTATGHKKVSFVCKDCGKYHTVAASRFEKAQRGN